MTVVDGGRTHRDPAVDALRAYAVAGVVLGHWLVTGLVLDADGSLSQASPLTAMPALAPASWVFQTLGLFFFTAGYASARSRSRQPGPGWLTRRLRRLVLPAVALLGTSAAVLLVATLAGMPDDTLSVALTLAISPLWFLAPLLALVLLTGPLRSAVRRWGLSRCAVAAAAVVAGADLAGRLLPTDTWIPPVTVVAAWAVPYLLGLTHADGRLNGRRAARWLLGVATAGLVAVLALGYPVSAVGVPGDGRSNLNPPTLFAVALAVGQVGLALSARPALEGLCRRPSFRRVIDEVNRHAVRIYLWHQPVLVGVALLAAHAGTALPGLHTAPDGPVWLLARIGWLPVLVSVLAILVHRRPWTPATVGPVRRTTEPGVR
ncbi:acyltransferase family protein [Micromonospora endophytica]|uniref:Acyltransferase n=1 Tax=Micromonospora endophytica TaxID=515350 RepID=A0A2W2BPT1_9ACTN|nr:acyltransferase [Micromonospora endophytica]PZF87390.1 acyltransferase [Micromonospora endophytica]RIW41553.1 acyltransferase [Micromonospora endophytica]